MSPLFLYNNIHLALELFGGICFFIVGWLFAEGWSLKRDVFSFLRTVGFLGLASAQFLHAAQMNFTWEIAASATEIFGLACIAASYAFERLPPRPEYNQTLPVFVPLAIATYGQEISATLAGFATLALLIRFTKSVDRLLRWLLIGFALLTVAISIGAADKTQLGNELWTAEHIIRLASFISIAIWAWKFLRLRVREEILIIFVGASLFIALLVTTTFSIFFLQRVELEARSNLLASARLFELQLESMQQRVLAVSQIIARNEELAAGLAAGNIGGAIPIVTELAERYEQRFIVIADRNGTVLFTVGSGRPQTEDNVLTEHIAGEAAVGNPTVNIDIHTSQSLSIRAAAPIYERGELIGILISGIALDKSLTEDFHRVSGFEVTLFAAHRVIASSLLETDENIQAPDAPGIGSTRFHDEEVFGVFTPIVDVAGRTVAQIAITTTPGELFRSVQSTNLMTMAIIFIIVCSLILPLYRLTILLMKPLL